MNTLTFQPRPLLHRGESIFTVASLMLYMGCVIPLLITNGASEGDGQDILAFNYTPLNLLYLLNYSVVSGLLLFRWRKVLYFISQNPLFLILMLLIPVSFLWSAKPDETLSGSIGMIGTTLFGLYIASRFTLKEQLNLLGWAFGMTIILSIIFIVALPKYGIMGGVHAGTPRGVFTHKNGLGKYMVLSNSLFLVLARASEQRNYIPWIGIVGSIALIFASTSTGALLNGIMVAIVILFSQIFQLKFRLFLPILILSGLLTWAISTWALDIATLVLGSFGKDLTLTGRADIWPFVIDKIQERPWLGYGFNGFWHGIQGESAYIIRAMRWPVPDSHNGYLDFILNIGLVGFSLFLLISWSTLVKTYALLRQKFKWEYIWPFIFLMYLVIINFTETSLIAQNSVFWVLYTATVVSTAVEFRHVFQSPAMSPFTSPPSPALPANASASTPSRPTVPSSYHSSSTS